MKLIDQKTAMEAMAQKSRILNPPAPKPRIDGIIVNSDGRMLAGKIRNKGTVLLVWNPEVVPDGFVSKEDAERLVESGYCSAATSQEIEAFLDSQETPTPSNQ